MGPQGFFLSTASSSSIKDKHLPGSKGTHILQGRMVLCLTENHGLSFFCLSFQRKLPAPSPRLQDDTAELQTSCHSFQQETRKLSRSLFPREGMLWSDQLLGNHQKSASVPQAVCIMSQMLVSLLLLIVFLCCQVLPLPHSSASQAAEAR